MLNEAPEAIVNCVAAVVKWPFLMAVAGPLPDVVTMPSSPPAGMLMLVSLDEVEVVSATLIVPETTATLFVPVAISRLLTRLTSWVINEVSPTSTMPERVWNVPVVSPLQHSVIVID